MGDQILQRLVFYQYATGIFASKQSLFLLGEKNPCVFMIYLLFIHFRSKIFRYKRHLAAICKGPDLTAVAQKSLQRLGASSAKCTKVTIQLKCCKGFKITIIKELGWMQAWVVLITFVSKIFL